MKVEMIEAARDRIGASLRETPLLSSPFLDDIAGRRVFVKPECLQHTGSFKFRGAMAALSALSPEKRARGVIAYSSGNHAQGVAAAARLHDTSATIVIPSDAPGVKIANTRALGAEVVLYDRATEDRDAIGRALANERKLTLIRPFDDPEVIAGQGTCGLEIAEQAQALGLEGAQVLVCCGGGGLTAGIALALESRAPAFRVHPVEPEGFDDMARSLVSGRHETNERTTGLCDAVLTPTPGAVTFPIIKDLCGAGLVVSDADVKRAMRLAFERLRVVVEPGGAVALAAALFHGDELAADTVICTLSGGNVERDLFRSVLMT